MFLLRKQGSKKKRLIVLLVLFLVGAPVTWLLSTYHIVDYQLYPKNAEVLDLRGQALRIETYEILKEKMPGTQILWDVPFQGSMLNEEVREITVTTLTAEDAQILAKYLPRLRVVNAEECADYANLLTLKQLRPGIQVNYRVPLNGKNIASGAMQVTLGGITEEELERLTYLPLLKTVTVTGGEAETLKQLQDYCEARDMTFRIRLGGEILSENAVNASIRGITNEELPLLQLLPKLKQLHLVEPEADGGKLVSLKDALPDAVVTWEKTVLGLTFPQDAVQIDLTDMVSLGAGERPGDKTGYQYGLEYPVQGTQEEVPTAIKISKYHPIADRTNDTEELIAEVEKAMAYFPQAEKVILCGGLLDNAHMSDFRDAHREDYQVVWSVRCGNVLTRTDAEFFMPVKYHVYYLNDAEAYNLRYLEDVVAVDIGHMNVSDISFVQYMPKLEYLILAHTSIQYIEPIRSCKNLKFLEVDWTGIRDLSPLEDCTSLEDLNIGNTGVGVEPLKKMTWLKNVWMIFKGSAYELTQALPDTKVVSAGTATVDSGWRDLPNYFAMRDMLRMYYMSW